jgi:hypothetical protein
MRVRSTASILTKCRYQVSVRQDFCFVLIYITSDNRKKIELAEQQLVFYLISPLLEFRFAVNNLQERKLTIRFHK